MTEQEFNTIMEHIISALKQNGYDPYEQLLGYITTGESYYITRKGNARELIGGLDLLMLKSYVLQMNQKQEGEIRCHYK